jgi:UDP-3-O-[3-hydroxymyristoyl] glucosamine N-acyltransferase
MKLSEAAKVVGGRVSGRGDPEISGVAGLREAVAGDVSFLSRKDYAPLLATTKASAVIAAEEVPCPVPLLLVKDPEGAVTRLAVALAPPLPPPAPGVHPSAFVDPGAVLGKGVSVGPRAVVEAGARVGDRTVIRAGALVGRGARIGADGLLHPGAVVADGVEIGDRVVVGASAVVGSDGFGFLPAAKGKVPARVPQLGTVVLGDDVDVGACASIARARVGRTVIGNGVKIDALVQVAHNCRIGDGAILAALVGLAGSTVVGPRVLMGGQSGASGHLEIGEGVMVASRGGITHDIPPGTTVAGFPAIPHRDWQRSMVLTRRLSDLLDRVRRLEGHGRGRKRKSDEEE